MILDILEQVMLILYAVARIAGTATIVFFVCKWRTGCNDGLFDLFFKSLLIGLIVLIGLGFTIHYDNPHDKCYADNDISWEVIK